MDIAYIVIRIATNGIVYNIAPFLSGTHIIYIRQRITSVKVHIPKCSHRSRNYKIVQALAIIEGVAIERLKSVG